jgi:predicted transcriptional regulator
MATPKIKSTYSLDPETIRSLEEIASKWKIPKSEVLRRAVAVLAESLPEDRTERLALWEGLQAQLRLDDATAARWVDGVRAERSSTSRPGGVD